MLGQPVSVFSALPEAGGNGGHARGAGGAAGHRDRGAERSRTGAKTARSSACEAVISRVEIQGRVLMVAVEQDVTERLRAQEQLQMQARVLESMAEAVLMVDEQRHDCADQPGRGRLAGL